MISLKLPRLLSETLKSRNRAVITTLLLAGLLALPVLGLGNYLLHLSALVFVYVALGLGLNVVVGLTGLLDLGYIGFYAVGAYGYTLLSSKLGLDFPAAALTATCLTAAVGIILGWPTIRTRGDYLALVTLGFGEMIRLLARNWVQLTNGPQGIMNIKPPALGGYSAISSTAYYYCGLALGLISFVFFWQIKHSAVGKLLRAIRDDEEAAISVGLNPVRWKLYAFAAGAWMAGLAGVFFASWQRFISPESFTLNESILILCIVVLGGAGRTWSVVLAAVFLVLLPESLRGLVTYRGLVLGALLVVAVVLQERITGMPALRFRRGRNPSLPQPASLAVFPLAASSPAVDNKPLLSIRKLSKSFGGVQAINAIDLTIKSGRITAILGANGAGKTTLFNCIAGSVKPESGEVLLFSNTGKQDDLGPFLPAYKRPALGVMRTFQQPKLFHSLTTAENVEVALLADKPPGFLDPLIPHSKRDKHLASQIQDCLSSLGLPNDAKVWEMTFVEQKLVELGRALAGGPRLLLVDEPAAGLAPTGRRQLADVLRRACSAGTTVVVIEHDLEFLQRVCDWAVVMQEGKIRAEGTLNDARVVEAIRDGYSPGYKTCTP